MKIIYRLPLLLGWELQVLNGLEPHILSYAAVNRAFAPFSALPPVPLLSACDAELGELLRLSALTNNKIVPLAAAQFGYPAN